MKEACGVLQKITRLFVIILILLIIQGCSPEYKLTSLVEKGKFKEAAKVYDDQKEYFHKHRDKTDEHVILIAENLNKDYKPLLDSSIDKIEKISWPEPESRWTDIKKQLAETLTILKEYDSYYILTEKRFTLPTRDELRSLVNEKLVEIEQGAKNAFFSYDHFRDKSFFDVYPISINLRIFVKENFNEIYSLLGPLGTDKFNKFVGLYKLEMSLDADNFVKLSNLYLASLLREKVGSKRPDFPTIMQSIQEAKGNGYAPSEVPAMKVGFLRLEGQQLRKNGLIEFPIKIEKDLPFEFIEIDSNNVQIENIAKSFDYLIILQILEGRVNREATNKETISSQYLSRKDTVPNPDYALAMIRVNQLQEQLRQAQYQYNLSTANARYDSTGAAGFQSFSNGFAVGSARGQLNKAMQQLQQTPAYIEKPVYENYEFTQVKIAANKTLKAKYYMLDYDSDSYFSEDIMFNKNDNFTMPYGLLGTDINQREVLMRTNTEEDIDKWSKESIILTMSNIIKYNDANSHSVKKGIVLNTITKEMLNNESLITQKYKAGIPSSFDSRYESVVVVLNPAGILGAGFFVRPDVVLTNYHVVEGAENIEIKTYNKGTTLGVVIFTDIRLDLALIKTQVQGTPVKFCDEEAQAKINPGAAVDAIGHPTGLEFSLTRGIISAIRKSPSFFAPNADEVWVIQTDAAINPGNSGGPLFCGDCVVGMNSQKLVKTDVEGLGFAIHYSEILNFINSKLNN